MNDRAVGEEPPTEPPWKTERRRRLAQAREALENAKPPTSEHDLHKNEAKR